MDPHRPDVSVASSPAIGRSLLGLYSLVLAYGGGLWLHLLHEAEGATELNEPPWVLHWLRDSSLALPVVAIGVWLGSQLAARLVVARYTCLAPRKLLDAVLPVCLALYASTVLA